MCEEVAGSSLSSEGTKEGLRSSGPPQRGQQSCGGWWQGWHLAPQGLSLSFMSERSLWRVRCPEWPRSTVPVGIFYISPLPGGNERPVLPVFNRRQKSRSFNKST